MMEVDSSPRRRCPSTMRKKVLQAIKQFFAKKLSDLDDSEIEGFLAALGGPKQQFSKEITWLVEEHIAIWVLNRVLTQVKKWITFQASKKRQDDGPKDGGGTNNAVLNEEGEQKVETTSDHHIPMPCMLRHSEIRLVAYIAAHLEDINALHVHSNVLFKMVTVNNMWNNVTLDMLSKDDFDNPCLKGMNSKDFDGVLERYRNSLSAMKELLASLYFKIQNEESVPRYGNRICLGMAINDVTAQVTELVRVFAIWNHALQRVKHTTKTKKTAGILVSILLLVAELLSIWLRVLNDILHASTNVKNAYNCLVEKLMDNLLLFTTDLEDFTICTKLLMEKSGTSGKEDGLKRLEVVSDEAMKSIVLVMSFALSKNIITGLRDMIISREYDDLMDTDQLGNLDLDNSSVIYNRKFFMKIITTLHMIEMKSEVIQRLKGLCRILPKIYELVLASLGNLQEAGRGPSYYGVMIMVVILPLVTRLANTMKCCIQEEPESYLLGSLLLSAITAFHDILSIANKRHVLVYSGEKSEILTKFIDSMVGFVLLFLEDAYQQKMKHSKIIATLESVSNDDTDPMLHVKKVYTSDRHLTSTASLLSTISKLWDALLLLVSLNLEHADTNINRILQLLHDDYSFCKHDEHEVLAFNILVMPKVTIQEGRQFSKSHVFLGNLISMYSHANDVPTLVDHLGTFVKGLNVRINIKSFLVHPAAIVAFHRSSKESEVAQMPIVIKHFTSLLKTQKAKAFLQYALISYLSGIELTKTVVAKVSNVYEDLLKKFQYDHTPDGLLMAIYNLIMVRKINAWSSVNQKEDKWYEYVEKVYAYVMEVAEMIGNDCSPEVWKSMFWLVYHITLYRADYPVQCDEMSEGIAKVLKKLKRGINVETSSRKLIGDAAYLLAANAKVFRNFSRFNSLMKHVAITMMSREIDEKLLDTVMCILDMTEFVENGFSDIFDVTLMNAIASTILKDGVTMKMKHTVVKILKAMLEVHSSLYLESNFTQFFRQMVEVSRQACKSNDVNNVEAMRLVGGLVDLFLFILKREEQLGTAACMDCIRYHYEIMVIEDTESNVHKGRQRDALDFVGFLNELRSGIIIVLDSDIEPCIETVHGMACLYVFVLVRLFSQNVKSSVSAKRPVELSRNVIKDLILSIAPTVLEEKNEVVTLDIPEQTEPSGTCNIVEAILLANVAKIAKNEENGAEIVSMCCTKNDKKPIDILKMLVSIIQAYKPVDCWRVLYFSSLLYITSINMDDDDDLFKVYEETAGLQDAWQSMITMGPHLLNSVCNSITSVLYKVVKRSSEFQITLRVVEFLYVVASIKQIIYMNRSGILGCRGTQLEVFKALYGGQSDELSAIIQIVFEKLKTIKTWNTFLERVGRLYNQSESQDVTHKWISRAAASEVLMLIMDKQYLKSLSNVKGEQKMVVLGGLEGFLSLYNKNLEAECYTLSNETSSKCIDWILLNYLMNTAISIKMYGCTKFQSNEQLQLFHYAFTEHLLDLATLGIEMMKKRGSEASINGQVATNVYFCVYNCIKTVEGMGNAQAAKLARPWMKRVHILVYIVTQFVELIENHDSGLFSYVARWMNVLSNSQLRDATRWYLPNMLTAVISKWYNVTNDIATKTDNEAEILRSNRILKNSIIQTITLFDDVARGSLFLLLPQKLRVFMKQNTSLFDGK